MRGRDALLVQGVDAINLVLLAANVQSGATSETIHNCLPDEKCWRCKRDARRERIPACSLFYAVSSEIGGGVEASPAKLILFRVEKMVPRAGITGAKPEKPSGTGTSSWMASKPPRWK